MDRNRQRGVSRHVRPHRARPEPQPSGSYLGGVFRRHGRPARRHRQNDQRRRHLDVGRGAAHRHLANRLQPVHRRPSQRAGHGVSRHQPSVPDRYRRRAVDRDRRRPWQLPARRSSRARVRSEQRRHRVRRLRRRRLPIGGRRRDVGPAQPRPGHDPDLPDRQSSAMGRARARRHPGQRRRFRDDDARMAARSLARPVAQPHRGRHRRSRDRPAAAVADVLRALR